MDNLRHSAGSKGQSGLDEEDDQQYYTSMVMMASNYSSIKKMNGNGAGGKRGAATTNSNSNNSNPKPSSRRVPPGLAELNTTRHTASSGKKGFSSPLRQSNTNNSNSATTTSAPRSQNGATASKSSAAPRTPSVTDMGYVRNDSIASCDSSIFSDQLNAYPMAVPGLTECAEGHVDISFTDPPTVASTDREGNRHYRHNPYSRSVSTVITNPSSMRSSLASSFSNFDSPSQMVNAPFPDAGFSSASSACSMDSGNGFRGTGNNAGYHGSPHRAVESFIPASPHHYLDPSIGGSNNDLLMLLHNSQGSHHHMPSPHQRHGASAQGHASQPSTSAGPRPSRRPVAPSGEGKYTSRSGKAHGSGVDMCDGEYAGSHGNNSSFNGNVTDQFASVMEHFDAEACTARGRQLLCHVLRQRDTDKSMEILTKLLPQANLISLDPNGCHVSRALVENLPICEVAHFIHALYPSTIFRLCTMSQHTRRVVQAIFEHHCGPELTPLVEILANDSCRLAMTQQGCIVLMNVLSHALVEQKMLFLPHLMPILATLATDQYGNYVVQSLFEHHEGLVTMDELNNAFGKHRISHSCHKCASNVMERLVSSVTGTTRRQLVQEFIFDPLHCHTLLLDCYGNFVLQAIIRSSKEPAEFQVIYDTVTSYLPNSPYGQKIGAKLLAKYKEIFHQDPPPIATSSPTTAAPQNVSSGNNNNNNNNSAAAPPGPSPRPQSTSAQ